MISRDDSVARARAATAALLLLAACGVGDGSDIGPRLPKLPDASSKVVVLDDTGRGVVGASVTVGNARALTGRNGRGDLLANPRGNVLVAVDAANGAAVAGDELGGYRFATSLATQDLPAVLFVPDLPAAATAVLDAGTQAAATTITSTGGASVTVASGSSVGVPGGAAAVAVRLGDLQAQHLPGDLPVATSGAWLFGRGLLVDAGGAGGATFTPPADLDLPDDLALGTGTASLFRLDPDTGAWGPVAAVATASAGRIVAPGAVAGGGIYVCAAPVAATSVRARVVDPVGTVLREVLVRVDQRLAVSGGDGRFDVDGVPATLADGSARSALVELFAGGSWLPARVATTVAVGAAPVDAGDLVLDTVQAGNVRTQQVLQGRAVRRVPSRLSTLRGSVAIATTSDENGQTTFEDVPAEWFGWQDGRVLDVNDVLYSQSLPFLDRGRRWLDVSQFFQRRNWYQGGRRSRTYVSDAFGGGPIEKAGVCQGSTPGEGRNGITTESGTIYVSRDFGERATATVRTERDGQVIVSGYSIVNPNGEHVELPLQRVLRTPLGAFDRHGLVAGTLVGADPALQHELRVTRTLSLQEWWATIAEGAPEPSSVPLDLDPAVTHAGFVSGVPVPFGNLAASECASPGGLKTLQKVGIAADVAPAEGQRTALDLPLDAPVDDGISFIGALAGASAELDVSQLSLALALLQPTGRVVDVVRGLRGNHTAAGSDLSFTFPSLVGPLAGQGWCALLDGSYASNGTTVRCSAVITIPRGSTLAQLPRGAVSFGEFPTISAPANGATVPASGFAVAFALPANALHGEVELRSDAPGETLVWRILVPRQEAAFDFVRLPSDFVTPLVAGRTYSLTVSACFGDGVVIERDDPYGDLSTFAQSIGTTERGVAVVMRRTIQITTN